VVPCYNEARRLKVQHFTDYLREAAEGLTMVFVDDGSRDETADILEGLVSQSGGRASLLRLERNQGKAEAVRHGLLRGLDLGADLVAYWDADLATPLSTIRLFRDLLQETPRIDAILGSRVRLLGKYIARRPVRHYMGRVFATLASPMLRMPVYDTQCGAKMFRRTPALEEALRDPFRSHWIFDVEFLGRLLSWYRRHRPQAEGEAFYEYPLPEWRDVGGSRVRPQDLVRAAAELAALYLRDLRHLPPPLPGSYSPDL
jgi:glycosyltransferase involved in cell wall biosynthesis